MVDLGPHIESVRTGLDGYRARGLRLFATSSFQTNSVVLLHLLSEHARDVPVYFLNTGFHFPQTLAFRKQLAQKLGLDVRDLRSSLPRLQQRDAKGQLLFASDPDHCCELNKIAPLDPVLASNDVWISGVRASQSATREAMGMEATGRGGILRYHPLLNWDARMVHTYIEAHALPRHPLEEHGYFSVGCRPCTRQPGFTGALDERDGRWFGLNKTECGLHLGVKS